MTIKKLISSRKLKVINVKILYNLFYLHKIFRGMFAFFSVKVVVIFFFMHEYTIKFHNIHRIKHYNLVLNIYLFEFMLKYFFLFIYCINKLVLLEVKISD